MRDIASRIKETKENGLYIECNLLGDGTPENPFRPEIFDLFPEAYTHLDTVDIDYQNKKCKVWVSKIRTAKTHLANIQKHSKLKILKETGGKE